MPEYLAPGVYIEEIPGNRAIEGVSTSTAGMVGFTQRGPENKPELVTSFGAFNRIFGGFIDQRTLANPASKLDMLPYAVQGFFNNGGARAYIVRIVGAAATSSSVQVYGADRTQGTSTTLSGAVAEGAAEIAVADATNIDPGTQLLISDDDRTEIVTAQGTVSGTQLTLNQPLVAGVANNAEVAAQTFTTGAAFTVNGDVDTGDTALALANPVGLVTGDILRITDSGDATLTEYVTVTTGDQADVDQALLFAHPQAATTVEVVTATQGTTANVEGGVPAGASVIPVEPPTTIAVGDVVLIGGEYRTVDAMAPISAPGAAIAHTRLLLNAPLAAAGANDAQVSVQTFTTGAAFAVNGDVAVGDTALALTDPAGLGTGDILRITDSGNAALTEYVTITTNDQAAVDQALLFAHPQATTTVEVVTAMAGAVTALDGASAVGATAVNVDDATGITIGDVVRIGNEFRSVNAANETVSVSALANSHGSGVTVTASVPMFEAHARFRGVWGNAMQVRTETSSLIETTMVASAGTGDTIIMLASAFGLYEGSVLELATGERATVASVNQVSGEVTLAAGLGGGVALNSTVLSVEFNLIAERIENGKVAESELFENLSMNAAHPRYAPTIVGAFDRSATAGQESSAAGQSELIRISDRTIDDNGVDVATTAADGRIASPVGGIVWPMTGGTDADDSIDPNTFIGTSSDDPGDRTGIQALENETSISLVAVPGQTDIALQKELLNHCEKMRYRFAVLETDQGDRIADARGHRQNFDSTRGAIYYPWLVIPDRFGESGDILKIPPAGHVLGIYARTDINRGVWKAPANEVVRGILSFETALTKGEQDILNPVHVNCFRDFRTATRGLRLWGARTLSSDPEWKYVNVRRLFLFVEQSLDNGLQWAVFEPNAEPLWATVKQSITGFLGTIWRAGGLEGVSEEEAFFVNVGYNLTMTQADIDNGRLIVEVGIAPVKPAEFVIIRISQKTREATS